jgi:hypothetical protein
MHAFANKDTILPDNKSSKIHMPLKKLLARTLATLDTFILLMDQDNQVKYNNLVIMINNLIQLILEPETKTTIMAIDLSHDKHLHLYY